MARYGHLPIYKAALDITVHFEKLVAGFSRYHKYTLGSELREASRSVLMQLLRANNLVGNQRAQRPYLEWSWTTCCLPSLLAYEGRAVVPS